MPTAAKVLLCLMLLLCVVLVSACASNSPQHVPVAVQAAKVPPLPPQARQPTPPAICQPTCSAGLTKLYNELLNSLTPPIEPAPPASAGGR